MFDHVAPMNPLKLLVIKWNLFGIPTDQFHVGETGFIKPLSGQNQPAHGDIKPYDLHFRGRYFCLDHRASRPATDIKQIYFVLGRICFFNP